MSEQDETPIATKRLRSRKTSEQKISQPPALQRPTNEDKEAWVGYWKSLDQLWRTEPEIDEERQRYLTAQLRVIPNVEQGIYPFKAIMLSRADVEWLLATHENGRGPVDWSDESQWKRKGLDLRGADLCEVDLSNLPLTNFYGGFVREGFIGVSEKQYKMAVALMIGTIFNDARMEGATLAGSQLQGASLVRAQLLGASLAGAQLQGADLSGAQLEGVSLFDAQLERANFKGAYLERANLSRAYSKEADFNYTQMKSVSFYKANLEGATFFKAHLETAVFGGALLRKVNLNGAQLQGANLADAQLEEASLAGAQLQGARLSNANMEAADLRGAQLTRADLTDVQLQRAKLSGTKLSKANLLGVQLQGADLKNAQLQGANLKNAQLQGANLSGTKLKETDLSEAQLAGTDLRGAQLQGVRLVNITLSDENHIGPRIADAQFNDLNLLVMKWTQVELLGDEFNAKQKKLEGKIKDKTVRVEEYEEAVRANRQLAVALQNQGIINDAARFTYRAQFLQRKVFWYQRNFGQYFFSLFLDLLAGYGYKPGRSFIAYAIVISVFATLYHLLGTNLAWNEAIVISMTAFHGRGFFPEQFHPGDPQALIAAIEAFVGLLIEVTFIATLTQRFFGK
jgi:uncharacterized protein YjbI with pentapeptide repeats